MAGKGSSEWANPAPAGLVALAVACFTFCALNLGLVDAGAIPLLGIWLLGGFIVQLVVAIIELRESNILGGNVFTFFCAFFMFVTGASLLFKFWMSQIGIVLDTRIDGWAWIVLAVTLVTWMPAYVKNSSAPMALVVIVLSLVSVPLTTIKDLGLLTNPETYATISTIIAIGFLVAGCLAMYVATGTILNSTMGKEIVPMPGPLFAKKKQAVLDTGATAIEETE